MATHEHVHSAVQTLHPVVAGVTDASLSQPTPCTEYDVRTLANHMLGTVDAMRRIGASEDLDENDPWGTSGDHMSDSWRDDLTGRLDGFADAWDDAAAYEGDAMGGQMRKAMIGGMAFVEVVLHGWDLAQGSGQQVTYDDGVVAAALEVMSQIGEMGRSQGAFGDLVELPDDASPFAQVLAQAGRDPQWTSS